MAENARLETKLISVDPLSPSLREIQLAAKLIRQGEVIAFPTETVYGLGADATNALAVRKIFEAKNRPQDNPIIVHVASIDQAKQCVVEFPPLALQLAERFWPGPLTFVLPRSEYVSSEVTKNLDTVAIRMPAHQVALSLIEQSGVPIAAPSANLSGKPSPTKAIHVMQDLNGRIPLVLDGGSTLVGVESTVISLIHDPPILLRPGGITLEELQAIIPEIVVPPDFSSDQPISPGMKYKHYSPETKLVVILDGKDKPVAQIDSIGRANGGQPLILCTNPRHRHDLMSILVGKTPKEIQANFFSSLRILDEASYDVGIFEGITFEGAGLAVMNRALKAAHDIIE